MNIVILLLLFVAANIAVSFYAFESIIVAPADALGMDVFLDFAGVVYAVIAAFIIYETLSRLNRLGEEINGKTIAIRNVYSFVLLMDDAKLTEYARKLIREYCIAAKRMMYSGGPKAEESQSFRELFTIPGKIAIKGRSVEEKKIIADHIVDGLKIASESRAKILSLFEAKISSIEIYLVVFLSLANVLGFYFLGIASKGLFMLIIFLASVAVSSVVYIVYDLSNPFKGFWKVKPDPYDRTLRMLEEK